MLMASGEISVVSFAVGLAVGGFLVYLYLLHRLELVSRLRKRIEELEKKGRTLRQLADTWKRLHDRRVRRSAGRLQKFIDEGRLSSQLE